MQLCGCGDNDTQYFNRNRINRQEKEIENLRKEIEELKEENKRKQQSLNRILHPERRSY